MRTARAFVALALISIAAGCGDASTPAGIPGRPAASVSAASTLTASISGPSAVRSGNPCEWFAFVSGGTAPYTYHWTDTRTPTYSTDPVYVRSFSLSATITLTVTDAAGQLATDTQGVGISTRAPICYA